MSSNDMAKINTPRHPLKMFKIFTLLFIIFLVSIRYLSSESIALNWDAPIIIEGSYLVFLNQIPNVDFSTPIGPVIFLIGGLGMKLSTPTIIGLNIGFIIFSVLVLIGTLLLLKSFFSERLFLFLAIFLASLLFTPRMLSGRTLDYAYTGIYNLYGYVLFFIATLYLYCDFRYKKSNNQEFIKNSVYKGMAIGSLVIFLLFLKNIFSIGVFTLGCSWVIFEANKKRYIQGAVLGGILMLIGFTLYYHFNLYPFFRDQLFVIQARLEESPFTRKDFLEVYWQKTFLDNLFIVFASLLTYLYILKNRLRIIFIALIYLLFGYLFCASIMQFPEHILSSFFAFFVVFFVSQPLAEDGTKSWLMMTRPKLASFVRFLLLLISCLFILKLIAINVAGLISDTPRLVRKGFPTYDVSESRKITAKILPDIFIKNFSPTNEVIVVGENNLFPYQSLSKPTPGGLLYWHHQVTFTEKLANSSDFFRPDNIFISNNLIYLSTKNHADSVAAFMRIYGDYIMSNYYLADYSEGQIVYKRNSRALE